METAEPTETTETTTEAPASPADYSEQFTALQSGLEEVRTQLGRISEEPVELEEPEPDLYEQFYGQEEEVDGEAEQREALQRLEGLISNVVEKRTTALEQRLNDERLERESAELIREFPELDDPKTAESAVSEAREAAARFGRPELGNEPEFVRVIYMAFKAQQRADQEVPAGSNPDAYLEAGSGSRPSGEEVDPGDLIVQAGGNKLFPGWGS